MGHTTPTIRIQQGDFALSLSLSSDEKTSSILVGTPAWYCWLEQNRVFRFEGADGSFSARREQRPGGWYWYASRRRRGILRIAYLGRSQDVDAARLTQIARQLATESIPDDMHVSDHPVSSSRPGTTIESPLLLTKLSFPRLRTDLLARPHLVTQLEQCRSYKLTLLSAPAGFGKTTLLSEWRQQTSLAIAWLSLDEEDNDPIRFWRYILSALGQLQPSLNASVAPLLHLPGRSAFPSALVILLNELATLPQEIGLVLDDYHLLHEPEIHQSLAFLLEHLPTQVHLLLASRSEPPFSLSNLRVAHELLELHVPDLRFGENEAIAFLQQTTHLSMETMRTLATRTEGWITGLQLAAFSLRGREDERQFLASFTGNYRHIVDYLTDEVLDHLHPEQLDFLLRTSLLARLSASLCDTVLERDDSQRVLEELEHSHLFLFPLDNERHWYRYHQLFAEVLRQRLEQRGSALIPTLQRRAAVWYEDHRLPDMAVVYALAARDFDHVIHLLERIAEAILLSGESGTVQGWLDALPDQLVRSHPFLSCLYAFLLMTHSQFAAVEERLQDAEHAMQGALLTVPETTIQRLLGIINTARSTVAINFGDTTATVTYAQRALDLLEEDDLALRGVVLHNLGEAYEAHNELNEAIQAYHQAIAINCKIGSFFVAVTAMGSLARLQARQGEVQQAIKTCLRALRLGCTQPDREDMLLPSAGKPLLLLGRLFYEQDNLDSALNYTLRGIELSQIWRHQRHVIEGYLLLAYVRRTRGELSAAREALQMVQRLIEESNENMSLDDKLHTLAKEVEQALKEFTQSPHSTRLVSGESLNEREREILRLLASGLSNREIATQLIITTGTVKWYAHHIYGKLGVHSRTQAIVTARRLQLLS